MKGKTKPVIAVDIGGTKILTALFRADGNEAGVYGAAAYAFDMRSKE